MNKIKAIIFDYDGVISESVNVKTEAFKQIYLPFGDEIAQKVVDHHEANGGMSRFEKFRIYHKNFLGKEIDSREVDDLAKEFSTLVLQKVIDAPFVFEAKEFISKNYQKYDLFISTGTPTNEIEIILKQKDIRKYFQEVYGSPEKKNEHVRKILRKNAYKTNEVVFIGDAISDRDAALGNDIYFIGRYTTTSVIKEERYLIEDFSNIDMVLKEIESL